MKSLIGPLAALGMLATASGAAVAAPPAYCALYAREYANQFALAAGEQPDSEPKIQDEAYYRCLNMDQEPEMPTTSAYYGTSVDTSGQPKTQTAGTGAAGPTAEAKATPTANAPAAASSDTIAPPAAVSAEAPAPTPPPKPVTRTADSTPSGRSYTGGKTPWTPEWFAACKKYFPNSFDEKDGTILPHGAIKRVLCR